MEWTECSNEEKIGGSSIKPGMLVNVSKLTCQHILNKLPSYEESQSYADIYIISPPAIQGQYDEKDLLKKVKHSTRVLYCSTDEGLVHITKHISSDVVILGQEYSWALEQLRGLLVAD